MDLRGNVFTCPYPLLGSNVIAYWDACTHDVVLILLGLAAGAAAVCALAYVYLKHCYPPAPGVRSVLWVGSYVKALLNLLLYSVFASEMLYYLSRPFGMASLSLSLSLYPLPPITHARAVALFWLVGFALIESVIFWSALVYNRQLSPCERSHRV